MLSSTTCIRIWATLTVLVLILILHKESLLQIYKKLQNNQNIYKYIKLDCRCRSMFTVGSCGESVPPVNKHLSKHWKTYLNELNRTRNWFTSGSTTLSTLYTILSRFIVDGYFVDLDSSDGKISVTNTSYLWEKQIPQSPFLQGCGTHSYTTKDIQVCVKKLQELRGTPLKLSFIGDSLTRSLFLWIINSISDGFSFRDYRNNELLNLTVDFTDFKLKDTYHIAGDGIEISFYWAPFLDGNRSKAYSATQGARDLFVNWVNGNQTVEDGRIPDLIFSGGGMWDNVYSYGQLRNIVKHYIRMKSLIPLFNKLSESSLLFWQFQASVKYWSAGKAKIPLGPLDYFNTINWNLLHHQHIIRWDTIAVAAIKERNECEKYYKMGIIKELPKQWLCDDLVHFGKSALRTSMNFVWNAVCNKVMNFNENYCCSSSSL